MSRLSSSLKELAGLDTPKHYDFFVHKPLFDLTRSLPIAPTESVLSLARTEYSASRKHPICLSDLEKTLSSQMESFELWLFNTEIYIGSLLLNDFINKSHGMPEARFKFYDDNSRSPSEIAMSQYGDWTKMKLRLHKGEDHWDFSKLALYHEDLLNGRLETSVKSR